jgi:protein SCO1
VNGGSCFVRSLSFATRHVALLSCLSLLMAVVALSAPRLEGRTSSKNTTMPRGEGQLEPDSTQGMPSGSTVMPGILRGVGITQRLNAQVPLNLVFHDETGKTVELRQYFGTKPVVLALVYFTCPNLCPMLENNFLQSLRRLKVFSVGKQYNVLTVSFDPHDTPYMALDKWRMYVGLYGRPGAARGWHFLTGSQASITALCNAVGYRVRYIPQSHQFAHAMGIMVLTPQGKLSRYFYGLTYPPGDLRLALDEASGGKIGSPVDALLLFCCSYDPNTGKYGLVIWHILMVGGILTLLMIAGLIWTLLRWEKRHPNPAPGEVAAALENISRHEAASRT